MKKKWDALLFLVILAIGSLSLLVIFSIDKNLAANQFVFWIIGLVTLFLISFLDYKIWGKLSIPFYFLAIFTLSLLFLVGEPVRGSVRWIDLGIFRFQPSEIAKVGTIFILAVFYLERSAANFKNLIYSFLIILPVISLIFWEPDVGNVLAILGIWFGISLACGIRPKHLTYLSISLLILGAILFKLLAPYQQARIKTFINPSADPLGTGYHLIQSKIAVGSGEFIGRGLGRGSQSGLKFLPEAESDFIFAATVEQLGFLGGVLLIILFSFLIHKILKITGSVDRFGQLVIVGTASFLILQYTVNISMNMGLLPITGITLPLYSYGGSSLISTLFLLGVIFSIIRFNRQ